MPEVRAVFFDAGWTLLRPHPSPGEIYAREARRLGADVVAERFDWAMGPVRRRYLDRCVREGLPQSVSDAEDRSMWRILARQVCASVPAMERIDFDVWFDAVHDAFERGESWRLFDDALPALDACRSRGITVGIVSNWSSALSGILDHHGLDGRVDFTVISSVEGVRKPDPAIFHRALDRAGVRADEALHVGDTFEEDVLGARKAGVRPLWLTRSPTPDRGVTAVETLDDLWERASA